MVNDKGILIKNIYQMLAYAYQVLRQNNYEKIASEDFANIQDLLAKILAKGIAQIIKQGLYRQYAVCNDDLALVHGKINITGTINNRIKQKRLIACEYDDLSENNIFNQILKTTAFILIKDLGKMSSPPKSRIELQNVMRSFNKVTCIDPKSIKWNMIPYHRNNRNYAMLLTICSFVLHNVLMSDRTGEYLLPTFLDEQMPKVFEKFVLKYYQQHQPTLHADCPEIHWIVDDTVTQNLPTMYTDIVLDNNQGKKLIIDTKYYTRMMQQRAYSDRFTLHSGNLYQIFAYVKNLDADQTGKVAGMLLYAKTDEDIAPAGDYLMQGNKISVRTLDLNVEFKEIEAQLNKIADDYFGKRGIL